MSKRDRAVIFLDKWEVANMLPKEDAARLVWFMVEYQLYGSLPDNDGSVPYLLFMAGKGEADKWLAMSDGGRAQRFNRDSRWPKAPLEQAPSDTLVQRRAHRPRERLEQAARGCPKQPRSFASQR